MVSQLNVDKIYNEGGDNDSGINLGTNDTVKFDIAGSTKWTLNSSGNLFPAATTQGIVLGATSDTAANRLDDYEDGTWTGTFTASSSAPSSAVTATGVYTKIGSLVYVNIYFSNVNTSGASGSPSITGLPFTIKSGYNYVGSLAYHTFGLPSGYTSASSWFSGSGSAIEFIGLQDNGSWSFNTPDTFGSGRYIVASGTYPTDA